VSANVPDCYLKLNNFRNLINSFNILFTSAGRRVALIQSFKKVLSNLGIPGTIVTTDSQKNAPAAFAADVSELVPRITDANYINILLVICEKYQIKLLISQIYPELYLLSIHWQDFEAKGVTLRVCSPETNQICDDQRHTFKFFKEIGVQTPELLDGDKIFADPNACYPFLIKPANGSCSVEVYHLSSIIYQIGNAKELEFFREYIANPIIQEFLIGEEYTLDILVNLQGKVRSVVPRLRIETRAGEIIKGITVKNSALIEAGKKVAESLPGAIGCITV
jgi:carbamoyl-phosphate synthase large subunit